MSSKTNVKNNTVVFVGLVVKGTDVEDDFWLVGFGVDVCFVLLLSVVFGVL